MCIREIISEKIENEIPFLKKIRFDANLNNEDDYISNSLLPYLFYANTIDNIRRIIPVFLNKKRDILRLPLYYSLGIFKLYADSFLARNQFNNIAFKESKLNILYDGDICKLESINYTSNDVIIRTSRGQRIYIDFSDVLLLQHYNQRHPNYYKKLVPYFEKVETYINQIKIKGNPLMLISEMSTNDFKENNTFHGAVFFTKKPNFLKSKEFKDFTINGTKFFNTIPSSKIEYRQGRMISEKQGDKRIIGKKKFNEINDFIVFTHLENYDGFFELNEEKKWLDTIMFDLTDSPNDLEKILLEIENMYKQHLDNNTIKDIYLLMSEKDINCYHKIIQAKLNFSPFILNKEQKTLLNANNNLNEPVIASIQPDQCINFSRTILIIKRLCSEIHLMNLFNTFLTPLFEIKNRYYSFYDPDSLGNALDNFERSTNEIKRQYFFSSEYDENFSVVFNLINSLKNNITNAKLEHMNTLDISTEGLISIITFNENEDDIRYLKEKLKNENIDIINPKNIKYPYNYINKFNIVIAFNTNKQLSNIIFLNNFNANVYLLLNHQEYELYSKNTERYNNILPNNIQLKEVLNINDQNIEEGPNTAHEAIINDEILEYEINLEDFVKDILKVNKNNSIYSQSNYREPDSIVLFFMDGSSIKVNENKYFFIHREEIKSLKECHVQAEDLKKGDIIFLLNHNSDKFEELLWDVAKEYPEVKKQLDLDLFWRNSISNYLQETGMGISEFRDFINNNGIEIKSDQSIQFWIDNEVYEPRNLEKLLYILESYKIIENAKQYFDAVRIVKKLKTRLPNELSKIQFAKLNDIEYQPTIDFPELADKMYQFMDIKTVSMIFKS